MNPNMVNDVTIAAGVAGYAAGMVADQIAIRRAARNVEPISDTISMAMAEGDADTQSGRLSRVGNIVASPLAIIGGLAVAANVYAYTPINETQATTPPTLEIVVDHSGATGLSVKNKPIVDEINKVAAQFDNAGNVNVEAIVASSGTLSTVKIDQVAANSPFGTADLPSATSLALSRASEVTPTNDGSSVKPNAGVLIITNGNSIGKTQAITAAADQKYGAADVKLPVFVVNVEGAGAAPAVTTQLKTVANQTGAKYWSADQNNLDTVASDVKSTIANAEQKSIDGPDRTPVKVLGGVAALAAVVTFVRRKGMPFGKGING